MQTKPTSTGYTLIEVMVSTLIVLGVIGGGVAAFRSFDARQAVINSGRSLEIDLRTIQKKAQSGDKPNASECTGATLDGWEIEKTSASQTEYVTRAICNGVVATGSETTHTLSPGARFQTSSFQIQFEVLTGKASSSQTIVIFRDSQQYTIQVTPAGGITAI